MSIWVSVCAHMSSGARGSQQRVLDSLGLELQAVVRCLTNKLWASADITGVGGQEKCMKQLREVDLEGSHLCSTETLVVGTSHSSQNCHLALLCQLRGTLTHIH